MVFRPESVLANEHGMPCDLRHHDLQTRIARLREDE